MSRKVMALECHRPCYHLAGHAQLKSLKTYEPLNYHDILHAGNAWERPTAIGGAAHLRKCQLKNTNTGNSSPPDNNWASLHS